MDGVPEIRITDSHKYPREERKLEEPSFIIDKSVNSLKASEVNERFLITSPNLSKPNIISGNAGKLKDKPEKKNVNFNFKASHNFDISQDSINPIKVGDRLEFGISMIKGQIKLIPNVVTEGTIFLKRIYA